METKEAVVRLLLVKFGDEKSVRDNSQALLSS